MGRRKSRSAPLLTKRKIENNKRNKLPTRFNCIACTEEESVEVKIEMKNKLGRLECYACRETFQKSPISGLTEAIDIYTEWVDLHNAEPERYDDDDKLSEEDDGFGIDDDEDPLD